MIENSRLILSVLFILILSFNLSCSKKLKLNENSIFRYNEHSNISSLDPAYSSTLRNIWPVNQLYNGLVQLDDSLNIKPDLARKWIISSNGITYDFLIKKNIILKANIAYGGMSEIPKRATTIEKALTNSVFSEDTFSRATTLIDADFSPIDDMRARTNYRADVAKNLMIKFFYENNSEEKSSKSIPSKFPELIIRRFLFCQSFEIR